MTAVLDSLDRKDVDVFVSPPAPANLAGGHDDLDVDVGATSIVMPLPQGPGGHITLSVTSDSLPAPADESAYGRQPQLISGATSDGPRIRMAGRPGSGQPGFRVIDFSNRARPFSAPRRQIVRTPAGSGVLPFNDASRKGSKEGSVAASPPPAPPPDAPPPSPPEPQVDAVDVKWADRLLNYQDYQLRSSADDHIRLLESEGRTNTAPSARIRSQSIAWQLLLQAGHVLLEVTGLKAVTNNPVQWDLYKRHILSYSTESLFSGGYAYFVDGTVLNQPRVVMIIIVNCVLATIYGLGICDSNVVDKSFGRSVPCGDAVTEWGSGDAGLRNVCVSTYGRVCFQSLGVGEGLTLSGIASFLMATFMQQTLSRWWITRERVNSLTTSTQMFSINISACVESAAVEAKSDPTTIAAEKRTLVRWSNLLGALVMMQAAPGALIEYESLLKWGLVTDEEVKLLQLTGLPSKYLLVTAWMAETINMLVRRQNVLQRTLTLLLKDVADMRSAAASLLTFVNSQIPYTYCHLMCLIVKMHLVLVVIISGSIVGQGIITRTATRTMWGYGMISILTLAFEGLLELHNQLINPFGDDPVDFAQEVMLSESLYANEVLLSAESSTPSTGKGNRLFPAHLNDAVSFTGTYKASEYAKKKRREDELDRMEGHQKKLLEITEQNGALLKQLVDLMAAKKG